MEGIGNIVLSYGTSAYYLTLLLTVLTGSFEGASSTTSSMRLPESPTSVFNCDSHFAFLVAVFTLLCCIYVRYGDECRTNKINK